MLYATLEAPPPIRGSHLRVRAARLCRRQACELLQRDPFKYFRILAAIHIGHWRVERWRLRVLRACYFYFRLLDDVADGDRAGSIPTEALLDEQLARWNGAPAASFEEEANLQFDHVWAGIKEAGLPTGRLRSLGTSLVEGLRWDAQRRRTRYFPSELELEAYYERVILAPAEFAVLVLGASALPPSAREISLLIGRLQSIRDLRADEAAGLINIPREARCRASLQERQAWCDRETQRCAVRLDELWAELNLRDEWRARLVLGSAIKTLQKWIRSRTECGE